MRSLDDASAMRDAAAYMDALQAQPGVRAGPVGTFGYCLGGRLAVVVACAYPERVAAAASIHGGYLVTDAPESPHRQLRRAKARLYFALADKDQSCTAAHQTALREAIAEAGVSAQVEPFEGALHGFAVPDFPVYDAAVAEKHYQRLHELFAATLG
jgi:carboxymethylenebutenolidase